MSELKKYIAKFKSYSPFFSETDSDRMIAALEKAIEQRDEWIGLCLDDSGIALEKAISEESSELLNILRGKK